MNTIMKRKKHNSSFLLIKIVNMMLVGLLRPQKYAKTCRFLVQMLHGTISDYMDIKKQI